MNEEQLMEWEVLESIYAVDENFKKITSNRLQYKFGDPTDKSFLVELEWPDAYPEKSLLVNLDMFYNSHISPKIRESMKSKLVDFAKEQEGMAASFTIIEYIKENFDDLTKEWDTAVIVADDAKEDFVERKDEPLTKAAKRRMWARNEGTGKERGWNWIDIVKHLSQIKDN